MTRKEIKKVLDNTKVYVNGKTAEIQEKLFSFGYQWANNKDNVVNTNKPFLFIREKGTITCSSDMEWFINHENKEITAEEILSLELTESYQPFKNREECWNEMQKHQPFGWVCHNSKYYQILVVGNVGIRFADLFLTFDQAADYTFADGAPFGKE